MPAFHEGKACDAVLRLLEEREEAARQALSFPEKDRAAVPIELACSIGGIRFGLEHTGIEPFEGLREMEAKDETHFKPIRDRLNALLPKTEHFVLHMQARATLGLNRRQLRETQDAIVRWATELAPKLPIARLDRYITDLEYPPVPGVSFPIALHRVQRGGPLGQLKIVHLVDRDLEVRRLERVRRAYSAKAKKLAAWKRPGSRTVLILEENDVQMTNATLVAKAIDVVEETAREKPDEVYLLSTAIRTFWTIVPLRIGDELTLDLSTYGAAKEIDPSLLTNLTGR